MNNRFLVPLLAVFAFCAIGYFGAQAAGSRFVLGIVVPYFAVAVFLGGFAWRIIAWSRSPFPFKITTTCGQQKSLPWIKSSEVETPFTKGGVFIRMALEVLCFRSLFRNTTMAVKKTAGGSRITYEWEMTLWVSALAFHYSFLVVLLRHLRFLTQPVPQWIRVLESVDSVIKIEYARTAFAIAMPGVMLSGVVLLCAALFLTGRRFLGAKVRYISLASDYFPLFLIIGIAGSGILMRYFYGVDILKVKEFTMGLVSLKPVLPFGIGAIFFIHILLVSVLLLYFPFSKLMHMGGIFLSPTRNLTADSRRQRHVNPWNYPVKTHTYQEYEKEFADKMEGAGLPLDKEGTGNDRHPPAG